MSVTVVKQDVVVRPLENAIQLQVVAGQGPSGPAGEGLPGVTSVAPDASGPVDLYVGGTEPTPGYSGGTLFLWDQADGVYRSMFFNEGRLLVEEVPVLGPFAISTVFRAVSTGTLNLTPYWEKAATLGTYRRLKATNGGSFTLTVLLNGVPIPGWDGLSVTGTAQSPTCAVTLAAGDRLDWVFSAIVGTPGMEGSIAGVWG